jgi:hypothetical protein
MHGARIRSFGLRFMDRLEPCRLESALVYIDHSEEQLAFETVCDHLADFDVVVSRAEYAEAAQLAVDMGLSLEDDRYRYLRDRAMQSEG